MTRCVAEAHVDERFAAERLDQFDLAVDRLGAVARREVDVLGPDAEQQFGRARHRLACRGGQRQLVIADAHGEPVGVARQACTGRRSSAASR